MPCPLSAERMTGLRWSRRNEGALPSRARFLKALALIVAAVSARAIETVTKKPINRAMGSHKKLCGVRRRRGQTHHAALRTRGAYSQ